jgi:hypothetical protein
MVTLNTKIQVQTSPLVSHHFQGTLLVCVPHALTSFRKCCHGGAYCLIHCEKIFFKCLLLYALLLTNPPNGYLLSWANTGETTNNLLENPQNHAANANLTSNSNESPLVTHLYGSQLSKNLLLCVFYSKFQMQNDFRFAQATALQRRRNSPLRRRNCRDGAAFVARKIEWGFGGCIRGW